MKLKSLYFAAFFCAPALGLNAYEDLPSYTKDGKQKVLKWANELHTTGETQFEETKAKRKESPNYWNDLTVYHLFPDRFNNGDGTNDFVNLSDTERNGPSDDHKDIFSYGFGGDLRGVIDRLDYIKALGMDALLITSFLYNSAAEFHAYCVSNPLKVDPRFGKLEDFQELVREAHARDMYIIFDLVANHLCDIPTSQQSGSTYVYDPEKGQDESQYRFCADELFWNELLIGDGSYSSQYQMDMIMSPHAFGPLNDKQFFARCGNQQWNNMRSDAISGDFWEGMKDLNTIHPVVQEVYANIAEYWIAAADVDGFRLDAAKHISDSFLAYFSTHVRDYAASIGKDNLYIVGETLDTPDWQTRQVGNMRTNLENPRNTKDSSALPRTRQLVEELYPIFSKHKKQPYPGLGMTYDFSHSESVTKAFHSSKFDEIAEALDESNSARKEYDTIGAGQNAFLLFVDSHDHHRFLTPSEMPDVAPENYENSLRAAYTYTFSARGMPSVYAGSEQGFTGECPPDDRIIVPKGRGFDNVKYWCNGNGGWQDSHYRQTMWTKSAFQLGSIYDDLNDMSVIVPPNGTANPFSDNWKIDPYTNINRGITERIREMNVIRKSCTPFRHGKQIIHRADNLIAYSRLYLDEEIVIVINGNTDNNTVSAVPVSESTFGKEKTIMFVNLFDLDVEVEASELNLQLDLKMEPFETAIFVPKTILSKDNFDEYGVGTCVSNDASIPKKEEEKEKEPFDGTLAVVITVASLCAISLLVFAMNMRSKSSNDLEEIALKQEEA